MVACRDELVLAGYNDSAPYGQLMVMRSGRVVREFLNDQQDSRNNVNRGKLWIIGLNHEASSLVALSGILGVQH